MTKTSWSSLIVIVIGLISIYIIYRAIYSQKEGYTDCFSYRADGTIGECDYGENNQELTQQQNGMASGLSVGSWSGGNVQPASEFIDAVESGESIGQLFTTTQQDEGIDDSDRRQSATITQQRQQYSDNILAQSGITNVRGREGSSSKVKDNTSGSFLKRIGQTAQSVITSIFGDNSALEDDEDKFGRPMENIGVENRTGAGGVAIWESRRGGTMGDDLSKGNWCQEGEQQVGEICCPKDNLPGNAAYFSEVRSCDNWRCITGFEKGAGGNQCVPKRDGSMSASVIPAGQTLGLVLSEPVSNDSIESVTKLAKKPLKVGVFKVRVDTQFNANLSSERVFLERKDGSAGDDALAGLTGRATSATTFEYGPFQLVDPGFYKIVVPRDVVTPEARNDFTLEFEYCNPNSHFRDASGLCKKIEDCNGRFTANPQPDQYGFCKSCPDGSTWNESEDVCDCKTGFKFEERPEEFVCVQHTSCSSGIPIKVEGTNTSHPICCPDPTNDFKYVSDAVVDPTCAQSCGDITGPFVNSVDGIQSCPTSGIESGTTFECGPGYQSTDQGTVGTRQYDQNDQWVYTEGASTSCVECSTPKPPNASYKDGCKYSCNDGYAKINGQCVNLGNNTGDLIRLQSSSGGLLTQEICTLEAGSNKTWAFTKEELKDDLKVEKKGDQEYTSDPSACLTKCNEEYVKYDDGTCQKYTNDASSNFVQVGQDNVYIIDISDTTLTGCNLQESEGYEWKIDSSTQRFIDGQSFAVGCIANQTCKSGFFDFSDTENTLNCKSIPEDAPQTAYNGIKYYRLQSENASCNFDPSKNEWVNNEPSDTSNVYEYPSESGAKIWIGDDACAVNCRDGYKKYRGNICEEARIDGSCTGGGTDVRSISVNFSSNPSCCQLGANQQWTYDFSEGVDLNQIVTYKSGEKTYRVWNSGNNCSLSCADNYVNVNTNMGNTLVCRSIDTTGPSTLINISNDKTATYYRFIGKQNVSSGGFQACPSLEEGASWVNSPNDDINRQFLIGKSGQNTKYAWIPSGNQACEKQCDAGYFKNKDGNCTKRELSDSCGPYAGKTFRVNNVNSSPLECCAPLVQGGNSKWTSSTEKEISYFDGGDTPVNGTYANCDIGCNDGFFHYPGNDGYRCYNPGNNNNKTGWVPGKKGSWIGGPGSIYRLQEGTDGPTPCAAPSANQNWRYGTYQLCKQGNDQCGYEITGNIDNDKAIVDASACEISSKMDLMPGAELIPDRNGVRDRITNGNYSLVIKSQSLMLTNANGTVLAQIITSGATVLTRLRNTGSELLLYFRNGNGAENSYLIASNDNGNVKLTITNELNTSIKLNNLQRIPAKDGNQSRIALREVAAGLPLAFGADMSWKDNKSKLINWANNKFQPINLPAPMNASNVTVTAFGAIVVLNGSNCNNLPNGASPADKAYVEGYMNLTGTPCAFFRFLEVRHKRGPFGESWGKNVMNGCNRTISQHENDAVRVNIRSDGSTYVGRDIGGYRDCNGLQKDNNVYIQYTFTMSAAQFGPIVEKLNSNGLISNADANELVKNGNWLPGGWRWTTNVAIRSIEQPGLSIVEASERGITQNVGTGRARAKQEPAAVSLPTKQFTGGIMGKGAPSAQAPRLNQTLINGQWVNNNFF